MSKLLYRLVLTTAVLLLGLLGGSYVIAQTVDSAHINDLLQQTKDRAAQANRDAELIESFTRSRTSWNSHATQLTSMTQHINAMGKLLTEMDTARAEGSPWQQEAIDEVEPLLRSMADHLTTMIDYLNKHQGRVHMPEYVDYARANRELSDKLLALVEDYADYSRSKARVEMLEQKLQIPAAVPSEE